MQRMINGRLVEVFTNRDGSVSSDSIRKAARLPKDRPLVLQQPDGSNKIINPGDDIQLASDQIFLEDIPLHKRGSEAAVRVEAS